MKKLLLVIGVVFICLISMGAGYVVGGSNLPLYGYPSFDKWKPNKPYNRDEFSFNSYKREVRDYIDDAQTYINNALNDKKRIDSEIKEASDKATEAVEEFNQWARNGY